MTWPERFVLHERVAAPHQAALVLALSISQGSKILDAGCGTGGIAAILAQAAGPTGEVIGIDREPEFIEVANAHVAGELRLSGLSVQLADINSIPAENDTFDLVWCCNVIRWTPEPTEALKELIRVAKPGGRVVLAEPGMSTRLLDPGGPQPFRGFESRLESAQPERSYSPPAGWKSMLKQAGLHNSKFETLLFEFGPPLDDDQTVWIQDRLERLASDADLRQRLTPADRELLADLADPTSPRHFSKLDFLHVKMATTLYTAVKPS